jgi:hypothetical protein
LLAINEKRGRFRINSRKIKTVIILITPRREINNNAFKAGRSSAP